MENKIPKLTTVQAARAQSTIADRLRAVLDEARAASDVAALEFAIDGGQEANHAFVAARAAEDHAVHILVYYIANGRHHGSVADTPEADPLHERCRRARSDVHERARSILSSVDHG